MCHAKITLEGEACVSRRRIRVGGAGLKKCIRNNVRRGRRSKCRGEALEGGLGSLTLP